jgi:hypothetical protein
MGIFDQIQQAIGGLGGAAGGGQSQGGFSIMDALGGLGGPQQQRQGQQGLPGQMNPFNEMGFLQKMAIGLGGNDAVQSAQQRLAPRDIGNAMPWLQQQQQGAQFPGEPQGPVGRPMPISPYQQALLNQRNNFRRG